MMHLVAMFNQILLVFPTMMMMTMLMMLMIMLMMLMVQEVAGNDNGLGLTPPMGWNSWNYFHCDIEETLIEEIAKAMVDHELDQLGYQYINLDDCWQKSRDKSTGIIQEDFQAFPSGMGALSEYVHSLGLKFGLYSDAGYYTCQRRPGSLGYESQDAKQYAKWKIDYLKYDNCYSTRWNLHARYQAMHDALNATNHSIFFSMCEWGVDHPATWASPIGNSWRTTGDINRHWKSVIQILDQNDQWHDYAGPGLGWNDPDMLEIGIGMDGNRMTFDEEKSHFTLWCLIKAPLLLGNDLRQLDDQTLSIITNKELIDINQDPLGVQGYKRKRVAVNNRTDGIMQATTGAPNLRKEMKNVKTVKNVIDNYDNGDNDDNDDTDNDEEYLEVWAGPLSHGHYVVVLFNRSSGKQPIQATWTDIGLTPGTTYAVRDLWEHKDLGTATNDITTEVESHGVVAVRLIPQSNGLAISNQ